MGIAVTAELVINLPREKVAAFVTEPANDPVWVGGIVKAKMLTEPPVQVGTKVARVAKFMGKRMHYTPEVVAYEPNALVAMRAESPFAMTIRYEFEDAYGGTLTRVCCMETAQASSGWRVPCCPEWSGATLTATFGRCWSRAPLIIDFLDSTHVSWTMCPKPFIRQCLRLIGRDL